MVESYRGRGLRVSAPHPQFRTPPPPHLHFVPFSPRQRSGPGPAGPDQSGPRGRCGCCPCCGLSSGPRSSAPRCEGAPASATPSTGTPVTPGSRAEPGDGGPGLRAPAPGARPTLALCAAPPAPGRAPGLLCLSRRGRGRGGARRARGSPRPHVLGGGRRTPAPEAGGGISEPGAGGPPGRRSEPRPLASPFSAAVTPPTSGPSWGGRSGERGRGLRSGERARFALLLPWPPALVRYLCVDLRHSGPFYFCPVSALPFQRNHLRASRLTP